MNYFRGPYPLSVPAPSGKSPLTKFTLVLDLDSTLLFTWEEGHKFDGPATFRDPAYISLRQRFYRLELENLIGRGDGTKHSYWGITRPYLDEFLAFASDYFTNIVICTAGVEAYADAVSDILFRDLPYPCAVFSRDDLETHNGLLRKPLRVLIPRVGRGMDPTNTLVLDDNETTFLFNPDNGVLIPRYEPDSTHAAMSTPDIALLQFKTWLLRPEVMASNDVRTLDKKYIFNSADNLPGPATPLSPRSVRAS